MAFLQKIVVRTEVKGTNGKKQENAIIQVQINDVGLELS